VRARDRGGRVGKRRRFPRALKDEALDGFPRADDDVVSIGIAQTANGDAADAAETDDGNG
jgi:hypothetical protein